MSAKPLLLLLGAGPRTGTPIARHFAQNGYQVAVASRSGSNKKDADGFLSIKADFSQYSSIPAAFEAARSEFGISPSVVVYNAYGVTPFPEPNSLFSLSEESFVNDLTINTVSAYSAAREALKGWKSLPQDTKKAFIYTGNILNVKHLPVPSLATLGVGKAASAYWIGTADSLYAQQGSRFFYADERAGTGDSIGAKIDGKAHAEFYIELAAGGEGIPWHATFVNGKGYVKF